MALSNAKIHRREVASGLLAKILMFSDFCFSGEWKCLKSKFHVRSIKSYSTQHALDLPDVGGFSAK
jgi:hypothetical protein